MTLKINELTLITGSDIELENPKLRVQQPSMSEIAFIGGEQNLYQSLNVFRFDSEPLEDHIDSLGLTDNEKSELKSEITPYDVFSFILQIYTLQKFFEERDMILSLVQRLIQLLMPSYKLEYEEADNLLILKGKSESDTIVMSKELFNSLKDITNQIFLTDVFLATEDTSEMSEAAKTIAEKMKKAEEKLSKDSDDDIEGGQFALMISILGVNHPIDYLKNLTVYQIYNQFTRFNLKEQFEQAQKVAMFGGSQQDIVNWYKKI